MAAERRRGWEMHARSVYFTEPGAVEVREREIADPGEGEVRVRAERSAVSPGTELLVYRGEVPTGMTVGGGLDGLGGDFEFPLRYGYAVVGRVEATGPGVDDAWNGRQVFGFRPHGSHFCAPVAALQPVPEDCSATAATFLPNVETAVNLVQDGAPVLGERAAVFGQGVVGLLTTALLSDYPLAELVTVDRYPARRERSLELGADAALDPDAIASDSGTTTDDSGTVGDSETASDSETDGASETATDGDRVGERVRERFGSLASPGPDSGEAAVDGGAATAPSDDGAAAGPDDEADGADLTYELSGNPAALDAAIAATGYDGRVVVGSWYGTKPAELDLGGRFHRSRVSVESSQVSTIDPSLRGRWSKDRRLDVAWDRLQDAEPERFVTHEFDVSEAPEAYRLLDERPEEALGVVFTY